MSEIPNCCKTDEYQCPRCDNIIKVFRHKITPHIAYMNKGQYKGNMVCPCGHHLNFKVKLNDGSFG